MSQLSEAPDAQFAPAGKPGMLAGLRVIECADELGEYCGLLLAGLGAEVIKIEPPGGSPTRNIGPWAGEQPDPEKSLFFFAYNRGKRSIVLDTATPEGREKALGLIGMADVLLDSSGGRLAADLRLGGPFDAAFPRLIAARITPFGDSGPWKHFKGSDLIHLALGGVMMNCGYDRDGQGRYTTPPIAPQAWHAYHIAAEQTLVGILAALMHRQTTGEGQDLSCAVHEAVSKNTELDLMSWVMRRAPLYRQTARHAVENPTPVPNISQTQDGRWNMTWGVSARDKAKLVPFLESYGMAGDLQAPAAGADLTARSTPGSSTMDEESVHMLRATQNFVGAYDYADLPWRAAQDAGLLWAPVRKPHENALDEHWLARQSFTDVDHPELARALRYPTSKWLSTATAWTAGRRAPLLGEHAQEIEALLRDGQPSAATRSVPAVASVGHAPKLSARGRAFPLQGVRILDFSWFLASAGGTRLLAALGAESIKVEWKENPDTRLAAMAPVGGRAVRESATAPIAGVDDADMGGQFNNKNAGKRGMSLNIRHPKGLAIARELVRQSDIVAEGFSPGVLQRLGLGYEVQKAIRPDIIYVQQSGMGGAGKYGRFRTVGPVAASFAGTTEMSGLPDPMPPAGWGYSYLDWVGAYGFAAATLGALYHRARTGQGQWIDSSQCEAGIFQTACAVLDWSANGREWERIGNRSPYKPAAPHGAYRCAGEDRWIAIACFDDAEWQALLNVSGLVGLRSDGRFATLALRLQNQDALDDAIGAWTRTQDGYVCMQRLQAAGVPAGVCQTAGDRCDRDPQLAELQWLTEVSGTKIGRWPVIEFPVKLGKTPAYSGGTIDRGAPCYGEDNVHVLSQMLGYSESEIADLVAQGVL
jgi:crotonobetainyl-CoA:carnitine CoA-transferase CaiB-like acyl-CoA transferase